MPSLCMTTVVLEAFHNPTMQQKGIVPTSKMLQIVVSIEPTVMVAGVSTSNEIMACHFGWGLGAFTHFGAIVDRGWIVLHHRFTKRNPRTTKVNLDKTPSQQS